MPDIYRTRRCRTGCWRGDRIACILPALFAAPQAARPGPMVPIRLDKSCIASMREGADRSGHLKSTGHSSPNVVVTTGRRRKHVEEAMAKDDLNSSAMGN